MRNLPRIHAFPPKVKAVFDKIRDRYGVTAEVLRSDSRSRTVCLARREFARELEAAGMTPGFIGHYLDRHRTSVLNMQRPKKNGKLTRPLVPLVPEGLQWSPGTEVMLIDTGEVVELDESGVWAI